MPLDFPPEVLLEQCWNGVQQELSFAAQGILHEPGPLQHLSAFLLWVEHHISPDNSGLLQVFAFIDNHDAASICIQKFLGGGLHIVQQL